jgi:intracellular multiplication protein IcmB
MVKNKLEGLLLHILSNLYPQISHYCDLETVDGISGHPEKQILIFQDGSCASILSIKGIKSIIDYQVFDKFSLDLANILSPFLNLKGHQIQFLYRRDLDPTDKLETICKLQQTTAKKLGLDVEDLITESINKYKQYVYEEDCYIVLFSRPALLDKLEFNIEQDDKAQFKKQYEWPCTASGQNLLLPISHMYERHLAFVSRVYEGLNNDHQLGLSVHLLDINDALRAIKYVANRNGTSSNWMPRIPGNGLTPTWNNSDDIGDAGACLYPPLPEQILNEPAFLGKTKDKNLPDNEFIRIGDRVYAPLILSVPPRTNTDIFNNLFEILNRSETIENGERRAIPFSISFMMEGDGMGFTIFKKIFAGILGFTSEQNRNINSSLLDLKEYVRDSGCVVKLRIAMMTWSQSDQRSVNELRIRKNKLKNAIESWGGAAWKAVSGDPASIWQSNCLALSTKHHGQPCAAPLEAAVRLLPLTRPASVFDYGTILHRSLDGSIMPLERFSSDQNTWLTLVAGKPGSGKSVMMNNLNFEACLSPCIKRLPYIGIIDIGVSSSGFIDLIRDALPREKQYLVVYRRLKNDQRDAINIMDTPLCQRFPLQRELEFKINFITALVTPSESDKPKSGMSGLVTNVLKKAYEAFKDDSEKGRPKIYTPGQVKLIDEALKKINFIPTSVTPYWEIVDLFFENEMYYECEVAQRMAVPILNDLVMIASSPDISTEYKDDAGKSLISDFIRGIRDAVNQYPIFNSYTKFDIGSARIMSIDLQDVAAKDKSLASIKQATLMYMIARQSFMQKLAYSKEDVDYFSENTRPYFRKIFNQLEDEEKILMYDEFHKTQLDNNGHKSYSPLQQQVFTDGRESRKWKMEIVLGSQLLSDFGDLVKIATNIYLLDSSTPKERDFYKTEIGITLAAEKAMINYVHGPNKHGTTFLANISTKKGTYCQLYTLTLAPMRLWALSTTAEDRKMRDIFYSKIGNKQLARQLLAYYFPEGGCKEFINMKKQKLNNEADTEIIFSEDMNSSIVEEIANNCINDYFKKSASLNLV